MKRIAHHADETRAYAAAFAKKLRGGEVILLVGDLGSGKTTFVKGLARALGVKQKVKSPTFTVMNVYTIKRGKGIKAKGRGEKILRPTPYALRHLIHVDTYRLSGVRELEDIGLGDWLGREDAVVAVEWGEKLKPVLRKKKYIEIKFAHGKKINERLISYGGKI